MQDFFRSSSKGAPGHEALAAWTQLYQDIRLPRAQKAQITSRTAGDVYEMQGPEFEGLSYDDCLPVVPKKLTGRMRWVWGADIDSEYDEQARKMVIPN